MSRIQSSAGNYPVTPSATYDTSHFGGPSFSASGVTLSGGVDAFAGTTVYDAGATNLTVGGFTASVSYGQSSNSNESQVASGLAAALNVPASPVTAVASGASVSLAYKAAGTAGNVAATVASITSQTANFTGGSFSGSGTLANGADANAGSLATPYVTLYSYDALGNLLCVEQHGKVSGTGCSASPGSDATSPWRVRRFTYDSLSRLLTAHNPESGTITYAYDADGIKGCRR